MPFGSPQNAGDEKTFPTASLALLDMMQVTVTFDRVFDVQRVSATRDNPKQTLFGFQSRAMRQCGVTVPGWPQIEPGMTVACLLKEPENWQTLQGWKNLDTGEVVGPDIARMAGSLALCFFMSLYVFGLRLEETLRFPWFGKAVFGLFPLIFVLGSVKTWNSWQILRRLRALTHP